MMKNKITRALIISCLALFLSGFAFAADTRTDGKNPQFKKQPELQQIRPKKPVKIKLKRSGDGKYTWDLTGDDVDEIVRADRRLKKQLNIE